MRVPPCRSTDPHPPGIMFIPRPPRSPVACVSCTMPRPLSGSPSPRSTLPSPSGCCATKARRAVLARRGPRPARARSDARSSRRPVGDPDRRNPGSAAQRAPRTGLHEGASEPPDRSLTGASPRSDGDWNIASVDPVERDNAARKPSRRRPSGEDVLLYIHGYRESFETAATSTVELSEGIRFPGATGAFHLAFGRFDLQLCERSRERHVVARCAGGSADRHRASRRAAGASISSRTAWARF